MQQPCHRLRRSLHRPKPLFLRVNGGFIEENESVVSEALFAIHRYVMQLRVFREEFREITMR